jgi:mRNA interferase MazF
VRSGSRPTPGGARPVLILTRDPVADTIGSVVVAALTRTRRGLVSELLLTAAQDGVPSDCIVNFDSLHTLARASFHRRVTQLSPRRMPVARFATRQAAERETFQSAIAITSTGSAADTGRARLPRRRHLATQHPSPSGDPHASGPSQHRDRPRRT